MARPLSVRGSSRGGRETATRLPRGTAARAHGLKSLKSRPRSVNQLFASGKMPVNVRSRRGRRPVQGDRSVTARNRCRTRHGVRRFEGSLFCFEGRTPIGHPPFEQKASVGMPAAIRIHDSRTTVSSDLSADPDRSRWSEFPRQTFVTRPAQNRDALHCSPDPHSWLI
jgi:hypothetical protein